MWILPDLPRMYEDVRVAQVLHWSNLDLDLMTVAACCVCVFMDGTEAAVNIGWPEGICQPLKGL